MTKNPKEPSTKSKRVTTSDNTSGKSKVLIISNSIQSEYIIAQLHEDGDTDDGNFVPRRKEVSEEPVSPYILGKDALEALDHDRDGDGKRRCRVLFTGSEASTNASDFFSCSLKPLSLQKSCLDKSNEKKKGGKRSRRNRPVLLFGWLTVRHPMKTTVFLWRFKERTIKYDKGSF